MIAFLILDLLLLACTTPALSNSAQFEIYIETMILDLNVAHQEESNVNPDRPNERNNPTAFRYHECQKNMAPNVAPNGGPVYDGCGQFVPFGVEGTLESMICAACRCHRSFHRKEEIGQQQEQQQQQQQVHVVHHYQHNYVPAGNIHMASSSHLPHEDNRMQLLALPSAERGDLKGMTTPSSSGAGTSRRLRTRFTCEQKDKMLRFATEIGWRKRRENEGIVNEFCEQSGIKRQAFIVWMHNNKYTLGKKFYK